MAEDGLDLAVDVEKKEDAFVIAKVDSFSPKAKVDNFMLSRFGEVSLLNQNGVVVVVTGGYLIISWI